MPNKIMKLKKAVNNRRASSSADYFAPMHNLAWDFWSQADNVRVAAARRSNFLHAFLLAVCEQTVIQCSDEEYWIPRIVNAVGDPDYAVDVFDSIMREDIPAMPGRRQVNHWFKVVRNHR